MAAYDLVIFDCDGVLVESEAIANRILRAMLNELGWPISYEETVEAFIGRSMSACREIIKTRLGRALDDGWVQEYRRRVEGAYRAELKAVDGVVDLLDRLDAAGLNFCVASSGGREKVRLTLELTSLISRFEGRIFSADDVAHGKPAPDLFLHAARRLDVRPASCAVVEDSPAGIEAGVSAGMHVYGRIAHLSARQIESAGARPFEHLTELRDRLIPRDVPS